MANSVTWEKELRDKASAEGDFLVCIAIDGKPAKKFGRFDLHTRVTEEEAMALMKYATDLIKKRKA